MHKRLLIAKKKSLILVLCLLVVIATFVVAGLYNYKQGDASDENNKAINSSEYMNQSLQAADLEEKLIVSPEAMHVAEKAGSSETVVIDRVEYGAEDEHRGLFEVYCNQIRLHAFLHNGDVVDIRLCYPNGEDYVVLAKKELILEQESENRERKECCLYLCEDEILYLNSAVVDTGIYDGAYLYASAYCGTQPFTESVVTYLPNQTVITELETNPNAVCADVFLPTGARIELEERMKTVGQSKNVMKYPMSDYEGFLYEYE